MKTLFLFPLIALFLIACSQNQQILAWLNEQEVYTEDYQDFLSVKRSHHSPSTEQTFVESEALTLAIEQSDIYNDTLLAAEVNEQRKAWLLARYLDIFIEENLTNEALQAFYNSDENPFVEPKAYAAHILVRTDKHMDNDARRTAYEKAEGIYRELKQGADFSVLASKHSDDSLTAKKGGTLGEVSKGDINEQFSHFAFDKLKPGEFSKPFQSRFGFHILKVTAAQGTQKKPYEKVETEIRELLTQKLSEAEQKRLLNTVKITRNEAN